MKLKQINRRDFLKNALLASGGILLAPVVTACRNVEDLLEYPKAPDGLQVKNFDYGVASFDPTSNSIIIWSRYNTAATINWEISKTADFKELVNAGTVEASAAHDFTIAVEIQNLPSNTKYYYRFYTKTTKDVSVTGETITLPSKTEAVSAVKIAVASCSNFPAGYFNVYKEMANSDADVIVHLGDYIYEYAPGQYGTNKYTASMGRSHKPEKELIALADYRERYRQYRSDKNLQLAHQKKPFICVWDDHEIVNDTYVNGAENHQPNEGSFEARKAAALQAYSEFIPLKTGKDVRIYRSFDFGNTVSLHMLDTRVIARSKQLSYGDYIGADGSFNDTLFKTHLLDPSRKLLGDEQITWLQTQMKGSTAQWQVLGQQVLMTKMLIPSEMLLLLAQITLEAEKLGGAQPATMLAFQTMLKELLTIKARVAQNDPTLTQKEIARVKTVLPYNLDAWDGYPMEREYLYKLCAGKNVVTLAGDTHNGWYGDLKDAAGNKIGRELAAGSVTSPGMEVYLGLGADASEAVQLAQAFSMLIDDLEYANLYKRGYLYVKFTPADVSSEWRYVDTVFSENYTSSTEKTVKF